MFEASDPHGPRLILSPLTASLRRLNQLVTDDEEPESWEAFSVRPGGGHVAWPEPSCPSLGRPMGGEASSNRPGETRRADERGRNPRNCGRDLAGKMSVKQGTMVPLADGHGPGWRIPQHVCLLTRRSAPPRAAGPDKRAAGRPE